VAVYFNQQILTISAKSSTNILLLLLTALPHRKNTASTGTMTSMPAAS
jgi:hypothetical protein